LTAVACLLALCAAAGVGGDGLLSLLPALALACLLLARRYPGERVLIALRERRRARWARPRSCAGPRRRATVEPVRGGLLIGRSLAVRPPPRLLPAS